MEIKIERYYKNIPHQYLHKVVVYVNGRVAIDSDSFTMSFDTIENTAYAVSEITRKLAKIMRIEVQEIEFVI